MAFLYNFLTEAGVAETPASWACSAVLVLCVYTIFKAFLLLFNGGK